MPRKEAPFEKPPLDKEILQASEGEDASIDFGDPVALDLDPGSVDDEHFIERFKGERVHLDPKQIKELADKHPGITPNLEHEPSDIAASDSDDIVTRYERVKKSIRKGEDPLIQQKRKHELALLIARARGQLYLLPDRTPQEKRQKTLLQNWLQPYLAIDADLHLEEPILYMLKHRLQEAKDAQQKVALSRSEEAINNFASAVLALKEEYEALVEIAPNIADEHAHIDSDLSVDDRLHKKNETLRRVSRRVELRPEQRKSGIHSIKDAIRGREAELTQAETDKERADILKRLSTLRKLDAEPDEDTTTDIEKTIYALEKAVQQEKDSLRISRGDGQLHGAKPDYTVDEIAHLKGIQAYLREKPANELLDKVVEPEKPSTKKSPSKVQSIAEEEASKAQSAQKLKTHHELMWDSYNAQKASLDEEQVVLKKRLGLDDWPERGQPVVSWWTKAKDTVAGVFDKSRVSTEQLLGEYLAKKKSLDGMRAFLLKPESITDRERDTRILSVQAKEALTILTERASLAEEKQKALEQIRVIQEKMDASHLHSTEPGISVTSIKAVTSLEKTVARAEEEAKKYRQSLAKTHTDIIEEVLNLERREAQGKNVRNRLKEANEQMDTFARREWEANAPLPLLRHYRSVSQHLQEAAPTVIKAFTELRAIVVSSPDKLARQIQKQAAYLALDPDSQKLVLDSVIIYQRIDALNKAHELEYALKHNPLLSQTKRGRMKHEAQIKDLHDFAYDRVKSSTIEHITQAA